MGRIWFLFAIALLSEIEMQLQKEQIDEAIELCRREVDVELHTIRKHLHDYSLTEEQAEAIATRAAMKAKIMTKKELIDDAKLEIANAAIEILKRSAQAVALFIVGLAFYLGSVKWPWK